MLPFKNYIIFKTITMLALYFNIYGINCNGMCFILK